MKDKAKKIARDLKKRVKKMKRKVQKQVNKKAELSPVQPNLTEMRDKECAPIAMELLNILASQKDLKIGSTESVTEQDALVYYRELYEKEIAPVLVRRNVRISDLPFIFQIATQPIQLMQNVVDRTIDMRYDQAVEKLMKVSDIKDVRISDIQNVLVEKSDTKK